MNIKKLDETELRAGMKHLRQAYVALDAQGLYTGAYLTQGIYMDCARELARREMNRFLDSAKDQLFNDGPDTVTL